jgi:iron complex outermembrane receptor protein
VNGGLGLSYNRARFNHGRVESFTNFPSFAPFGSMAGQTMSRQPEFQANANATFRTQFRGDWDIYTRGDVNYQSRWYVGLPNQGRMPGRFRANARVGLESDKYTIELWVNNMFDDDTVESAFRDVYLSNAIPGGASNFDTLFPWRLTASHPTLRTMGLTLRGRF